MKIIFNGTIFYKQKYGGISRYFYNLGNELIKKKFKFVGTNLTRCNAFFVSEKYSDRISIKIPDPKNLLMHTNSNFRESRDESGKLNFKSGEDRIKEIYECKIFDLNDQKIKKIKNLFDKS